MDDEAEEADEGVDEDDDEPDVDALLLFAL